MIKQTLLMLLSRPAGLWFRVRYGGIWRVKEILRGSAAPNRLLLEYYLHYFEKRGSWIGYRSNFAGEPVFPHGPYGVFISNEAQVGKNAVIFQHVTIGSNTIEGSNMGSPSIGDDVYIGAGAKIIGGIHIGNGCRIGAGAVVYSDMPDNSVAVCAPTRIINKGDPLDNRYYRLRPDRRWEYWLDGKWIIDPDRGRNDASPAAFHNTY